MVLVHVHDDKLAASSDSTVMTSNQSGTEEPCHAVAKPIQICSSLKKKQSPILQSLKVNLSSFWRMYRSFVRNHHIKLELVDGAIHRLLFWLPHHDHQGHATPWREVLYGLLSVNQLAMYCSQQQQIENAYGFSVRTSTEPTVPATSLRIGQAIIHCLMPSLLQLMGTSTTPEVRTKLHAHIRWRLEQLKFVIRIYLLYSYWNQYTAESKGTTCPGIMLEGGLYQATDQPLGISQEELQSIKRRQQYKGRRTGLVITKYPSTTNFESHSSSKRKIIWGEILYCFRSLWWAQVEARHSGEIQIHCQNGVSISSDPLFPAWIISLLVDIVSLGLLSTESHNNDNPFSKNEWNRRRMKLFLYALRAPIWNRVTSPTLERTSDVLHRVPLIGGLIDSYLWDWILYWKHPYVSEGG